MLYGLVCSCNSAELNVLIALLKIHDNQSGGDSLDSFEEGGSVLKRGIFIGIQRSSQGEISLWVSSDTERRLRRQQVDEEVSSPPSIFLNSTVTPPVKVRSLQSTDNENSYNLFGTAESRGRGRIRKKNIREETSSSSSNRRIFPRGAPTSSIFLLFSAKAGCVGWFGDDAIRCASR